MWHKKTKTGSYSKDSSSLTPLGLQFSIRAVIRFLFRHKGTPLLIKTTSDKWIWLHLMCFTLQIKKQQQKNKEGFKARNPAALRNRFHLTRSIYYFLSARGGWWLCFFFLQMLTSSFNSHFLSPSSLFPPRRDSVRKLGLVPQQTRALALTCNDCETLQRWSKLWRRSFFFFDRSFFAECTVPRRAYACEQVITRVKKRLDGKSMWDELEKICKWG